LFSLQKIIVSSFVVFLSVKGFAGDPYTLSAGARQTGMAQVCIMNNDFWSSFHNQAGLAFNKTFSFGLNYENRFCIKELGTRSAAMTICEGSVSTGAVYSHFGYSDFRRQMTGLACGMPISKIIAAGVQIDYFSERTTGEYNNNQMLTCEAGIIVTASENVNIGVHVFNPIPNSVRKSDMPTGLNAGAGIHLSKELFAGLETEMSTGHNLVIRAGFEYEAVKKFMVRGGFSTENNSLCFGFGHLVGPVMIDFGFATHEQLGITSSVSVIFKINEK
jgi:hypothetical protein